MTVVPCGCSLVVVLVGCRAASYQQLAARRYQRAVTSHLHTTDTTIAQAVVEYMYRERESPHSPSVTGTHRHTTCQYCVCVDIVCLIYTGYRPV